jgi:hypothetical protein
VGAAAVALLAGTGEPLGGAIAIVQWRKDRDDAAAQPLTRPSRRKVSDEQRLKNVQRDQKNAQRDHALMIREFRAEGYSDLEIEQEFGVRSRCRERSHELSYSGSHILSAIFG